MPRRALSHSLISFRTVHSSKGLEADHVILPNLTTGTFGFPSQIVVDPVLTLAMAADDEFAHAEERRLFYVSITRAKNELYLCYPLMRAGFGNSGDTYQSPSRFLAEIPKNLLNEWNLR